MPVAREREASPASEKRNTKKQKVDNLGLPAGPAIHLPDPASLVDQYKENRPYKHLSVGGLFDDAVLEGLVTESRSYGIRHEEGSLPGWGWEHKETDIYKIRQTPDLTSLTPEHLPEETLEKLPYLCKLKESIYSKEFRQFIQKVTGCGPLSGLKVDGSVSTYTRGSHLLLHDDSISTRVVSYILYLPNSHADLADPALVPSADNSFLKGWNPEWGGTLELYPIADGESKDVGPPAIKRAAKEDVKWGNLVFFEVQPGKSYHSVEEVVAADGRQRLSINGWFHRPIEGEEGYEKQDATALKQKHSSLAQITSTPAKPMKPYPEDEPVPTGLTSAQVKYLSKYLSPSYLVPETLERLAGQFVAGSEVLMHNFLKPEVANAIKAEVTKVDGEDYAPFNKDGKKLIPSHDVGESSEWKLEGPASKHRYLGLSAEKQSSTRTPTLSLVLNELYPSSAFRAWLSVVSSLVPLAYRAEARRFRKGLDYTLANGEEKEGDSRLDAVLGLTWWAKEDADDEADDEQDVGGWECYLASPDADEDPAVYKSTKIAPSSEHATTAEKDEPSAAPPKESENTEKPRITMGGVDLEFDESQFSPSDFDTDSEGGDLDDGPLLHLGLGFNKFLLVLREPTVMRFVKYLSAAADGSRWDVSGEWDVGQLEVEDEEAEEDEGGDEAV